jgi:hypothetical protein
MVGPVDVDDGGIRGGDAFERNGRSGGGGVGGWLQDSHDRLRKQACREADDGDYGNSV